ncbi:hypothetical protein QQ045_016040 [Rhodiola kirilowii]
METNTNKVELIQQAVQSLIDEHKKIQGLSVDQRLTSGEDDAQLLLSKLLLQLETLHAKSTSELEEVLGGIVLDADSLAADEVDTITTPEGNHELSKEVADEIIKELKKVRRQNVVTHCLLSAMMVLTLVWQLSEIALLSKVKNGLNNPLKALRGMLLGAIKRLGNGKSRGKESDESRSLPKIIV